MTSTIQAEHFNTLGTALPLNLDQIYSDDLDLFQQDFVGSHLTDARERAVYSKRMKTEKDTEFDDILKDLCNLDPCSDSMNTMNSSTQHLDQTSHLQEPLQPSIATFNYSQIRDETPNNNNNNNTFFYQGTYADQTYAPAYSYSTDKSPALCYPPYSERTPAFESSLACSPTNNYNSNPCCYQQPYPCCNRMAYQTNQVGYCNTPYEVKTEAYPQTAFPYNSLTDQHQISPHSSPSMTIYSDYDRLSPSSQANHSSPWRPQSMGSPVPTSPDSWVASGPVYPSPVTSITQPVSIPSTRSPSASESSWQSYPSVSHSLTAVAPASAVAPPCSYQSRLSTPATPSPAPFWDVQLSPNTVPSPEVVNNNNNNSRAPNASWSSTNMPLPRLTPCHYTYLNRHEFGQAVDALPTNVRKEKLATGVKRDFSKTGRSATSSKRRKDRKLQLWEFILDLLTDSTNGAVEWVDQPHGLFRVVSQTSLVHKWSSYRNRGRMNFEKLTRTLRFYYPKGFLTKIQGKQNLYKYNYERLPTPATCIFT